MKKMSTLHWVAVMMLSFLFVTTSCKVNKQAATPQKVNGSYAAKEKALLWKIDKKGLQKPSYLFGTIHIIPKKDYFMPDYVTKALDASDKVVFEINMDEMNDLSMMAKIMDKLFMKDGNTLKTLLNEEDYKRVKERLNANPMIAMMGDAVDKIKPVFVSSMIAQDEMGGNPMGGGIFGGESDVDSKSYEFELATLARKAKKPISGLETVEYQMSIFDEIPLKDQAEMLVDALDADTKDGNKMINEMIKTYKEQDIAELYRFINENSASYKDFEGKLLTKRNQNWIPLMEEMMSNHSHFFAVGAGHLGGENGVIALLRQEGYILTPVRK